MSSFPAPPPPRPQTPTPARVAPRIPNPSSQQSDIYYSNINSNGVNDNYSNNYNVYPNANARTAPLPPQGQENNNYSLPPPPPPMPIPRSLTEEEKSPLVIVTPAIVTPAIVSPALHPPSSYTIDSPSPSPSPPPSNRLLISTEEKSPRKEPLLYSNSLLSPDPLQSQPRFGLPQSSSSDSNLSFAIPIKKNVDPSQAAFVFPSQLPARAGDKSWLQFSGASGSIMTPVVAAANAPMAFGVLAYYMALVTAAIVFCLGAFGILWWWYDISPLYNNNFNLVSAIYAVVVSILIAYEEIYGLQALRSGIGQVFDVAVSSYNMRSLTYAILSGVLFLSWATVTGAVCLLLTAFVNRVACANNEIFIQNLKKKRPTTLTGGATEKISTLRRISRFFKQGVLGIWYLRQTDNFAVVFWVVLYSAGNIVLFVMILLQWINQVRTQTPAYNDEYYSYWITPAKAFGWILDLNCAIILLPVCRTLLRWLYRQSTKDQQWYTLVLRSILQFVPLDHNLTMHKLIAYIILIAAFGHTFSHFVNYALAEYYTINYFQGPWALISGGILIVVMFLLYSGTFPRVRMANFEIFFETHHLFVIFFVLLLVHGKHGVGPNFWKFFIAPATIYVADRLLRIYRGRQLCELLSVRFMQDVMCLEFSKNVGVFTEPYFTGQYVLLQCPAVAALQWHPFTISSAPSAPTVTLNIKININKPTSFTYKVAAYLAEMRTPLAANSANINDLTRIDFQRIDTSNKQYKVLRGRLIGPDMRPIFRVDGYYSAPTQHLTEYRAVLIVAGGIGATPLSASLQQVVQHQWHNDVGETRPAHVFFVWIVAYKDISGFTWLLQMIESAQEHINSMKKNKSFGEKTFEFHIYVTSLPKDLAERKRKQAIVAAEQEEYRAAEALAANPTTPSPSNAPAARSLYSGFLSWDFRQLAVEMMNPRNKSKDAKWPLNDHSFFSSTNDNPNRTINIEKDGSSSMGIGSPSVSQGNVKQPPVKPLSSDLNQTERSRNSGNNNPTNNSLQLPASFDDVKVYADRPVWSDIFTSIGARHSDHSVGVMFCGSPAIAKDLREEAVNQNIKKGSGKVAFKMHVENF